MKHRLINLLIIVFLSAVHVSSQSKDDIYNINLELGIKYTPIEWIGGPLLGLGLESESKKVGVHFRNDIVLSVGQDPIQTESTYRLVRYHTYNYLDIDYKLTNKLSTGAGIGWIFLVGENNRFNSENGYTIATVFLKYNIKWLTFELRGDIPLEQYEEKKVVGPEFLFPVSLGCYYSFSPRHD